MKRKLIDEEPVNKLKKMKYNNETIQLSTVLDNPRLYLIILGYSEDIKENCENIKPSLEYKLFFNKVRSTNHGRIMCKIGMSKDIFERIRHHLRILKKLNLDRNPSFFVQISDNLGEAEKELRKFCYDSKFTNNCREEILSMNDESDVEKIIEKMKEIEKKYEKK